MRTDQEKNKLITLYNPTLEDVTIESDKKGSQYETYTLKSGDITQFPQYIADLIIEKFVDREYWKNPPNSGRVRHKENLRQLMLVSHK
jgi:hypothetical protein